MRWFRNQPPAPTPPPREPDPVMLSAADDLVTRAEKVVAILGYRGAVGGFVLDVYRVLKGYEELDAQAAQQRSPLETVGDDKKWPVMLYQGNAMSPARNQEELFSLLNLGWTIEAPMPSPKQEEDLPCS